MECVKFTMAAAAIAAAGWSMPALPAEPAAKVVQATPTPTATPSMTPTPTPTTTTTPPSTLAPSRGQPLHRIDPAASAASGSHDDADVHTTNEDGRTVTRNAHDRNATPAASSPQ